MAVHPKSEEEETAQSPAVRVDRHNGVGDRGRRIASTVASARETRSNRDSEESKPVKYECSGPEPGRDRGLPRSSSPPPATNATSPFVPFEVLDDCGLAPSCRRLRPLGSSLAFLKTHKTASSTIANVVNRVVDGRDLDRMTPERRRPPGLAHGVRRSSGDAAVPRRVRRHRRPRRLERDRVRDVSAGSRGVVRDRPGSPVADIISAYDYFGDFGSWRECLDFLRDGGGRGKARRRAWYVDSVAFDLGWYHRRGPVVDDRRRLDREFDRSADAVRSFVRRLDREMDVVLVAERTTESLLLLSTALPGLHPQELILYNMKHNATKKPVYPNAAETREMARFLSVDRRIYDHFEGKLSEWWDANGQTGPCRHK